ncbi:SRPBCC family protein [Virgibacillus sp. C22-A2]|uniref:SRPBCC family protein n=1 Tax=Virgibacillus tibetensis TaxID=3042313 RepID=A0ABU6KE23_9BACI|nr:SRPBCC family protein [Virgibacillus sp. C22-A2]
MPSGKHQVEIDIPIEYIWNFVSDMNKWAPLVPGYVTHETLSDRQSTWKFKGEVGRMQKNVTMKLDIIEWVEPTRVSFNLTGINENVVGKGYFEAEELSHKITKMTGHLTISAKGMAGPMINTVLRTIVPKTTREFTEAIANRIKKVEVVMH